MAVTTCNLNRAPVTSRVAMVSNVFTVTALVSSVLLMSCCDAQLQVQASKPKRGLGAALGYGLPGVAVPAAGSLVAPRGYFFPGSHLAAPVSYPAHYAAAPYAAASPVGHYAAPAAAAYAPAPAHAHYAAPAAAFAAAPAHYAAAPAAHAAYAAPAAHAAYAAPATYAKPAGFGYGYLG